MENEGIVFTRPNAAELLPEPLREPRAGEVLVRTAFSTISSGTERANLTGDPNIDIRSPGTDHFPRRCGYSSSGIVERVGEGVTSVRPGDAVAMSRSLHRRFNCLPEALLCRLDPGTELREAALWYIATFPLAAIRKCRLELGESALVMGQGALGMMAVRLLRAAGAVPIVAADPVREKRAQALGIGADHAFDPLSPDFAQSVRACTDGGVRVAIEVTGVGRGLDGALDCMAPAGRVALLGCTRHSDFSIDYYRKVHGPGITLIGAHTAARPGTDSSPGWWTAGDDMRALRRLCGSGRLSLAPLIAETHRPEEAPEVYARLARGGGFPLVQFDWRDEG